MRARILIVAATLFVLISAPTLHGQQAATLTTARELYAAANYDESIKVLDELMSNAQTRADKQSIGVYRILCLTALGRSPDADAQMEMLVADDPLYRPPADVLSPRIQASFSTVRKRMLPAIIQQQYAEAKGAYDRQEYATAAGVFKRVLDELADPDMHEAARHSPLSDLRTLAIGFHDLSVKASAPPPPPVAAVPPPPAQPIRDYRRLYSAGDPEVLAPTIIRQNIPAYPWRLTDTMIGMVEVTIGLTGQVESVRLITPIQAQYDRLVTQAAERWQYQPATLDGVPVKFQKRVQITVAPPTN